MTKLSKTPIQFFFIIIIFLLRYEKQCNILYNQTYNLEQVSFATDGLKDAQQTVCISNCLCIVCNSYKI